MRLLRICAPAGVHTFFLLISLWGAGSTTGHAHPIVYSQYSLEFEGEQWVLSFEQKTRYLRDAIYLNHPNLKGINLNSEVFLEATATYLSTTFTLTYHGEPLTLVPRHMHYGGLRFNATFLVTGLPEDPDYLSLRTDGFDAHEHSVVSFSMAREDDNFVNYFNRTQRQATFDFANHQYVDGEIEPRSERNYLLIAIGLILFIGLLAAHRRHKRRSQSKV